MGTILIKWQFNITLWIIITNVYHFHRMEWSKYQLLDFFLFFFYLVKSNYYHPALKLIWTLSAYIQHKQSSSWDLPCEYTVCKQNVNYIIALQSGKCDYKARRYIDIINIMIFCKAVLKWCVLWKDLILYVFICIWAWTSSVFPSTVICELKQERHIKH